MKGEVDLSADGQGTFYDEDSTYLKNGIVFSSDFPAIVLFMFFASFFLRRLLVFVDPILRWIHLMYLSDDVIVVRK